MVRVGRSVQQVRYETHAASKYLGCEKSQPGFSDSADGWTRGTKPSEASYRHCLRSLCHLSKLFSSCVITHRCVNNHAVHYVVAGGHALSHIFSTGGKEKMIVAHPRRIRTATIPGSALHMWCWQNSPNRLMLYHCRHGLSPQPIRESSRLLYGNLPPPRVSILGTLHLLMLHAEIRRDVREQDGDVYYTGGVARQPKWGKQPGIDLRDGGGGQVVGKGDEQQVVVCAC